MTHDTTNHQPTPEFRDSLEREVVRAWRRDAHFGATVDTPSDLASRQGSRAGCERRRHPRHWARARREHRLRVGRRDHQAARGYAASAAAHACRPQEHSEHHVAELHQAAAPGGAAAREAGRSDHRPPRGIGAYDRFAAARGARRPRNLERRSPRQRCGTPPAQVIRRVAGAPEHRSRLRARLSDQLRSRDGAADRVPRRFVAHDR